MATFLTTRKMAPALAARIEASVRGNRSEHDAHGGSRWGPRLVAVARLALVVAVAVVIAVIVLARRADRRELEKSRAALLEVVRSESGALTASDQEAVERAESWLGRFGGGYEGDFVVDELRAPGALATRMTRPMIYVRVPMEALHGGAKIGDAVAASLKDPLALCMVEPPSARTEKVLFDKVRASYSRGAEQHTPNVRRLQEAVLGLPFLTPPWAETVRQARTPDELDDLRTALKRAPIDAATRAAKAELLLLAIDEPGEPGGATELDGERAHQVRLGLVDLPTGKVLLRMRKRVEPSWVSPSKRPEYAGALDGCRMAFDVYDSIGACCR